MSDTNVAEPVAQPVLEIMKKRLSDATYCFKLNDESQQRLSDCYNFSTANDSLFYLLVNIEHGIHRINSRQLVRGSTLVNGLPRYFMQRLEIPLHVRGTTVTLRLVTASANRVIPEEGLLVRKEWLKLQGRSYCKPPDQFVRRSGITKAIRSALSKDDEEIFDGEIREALYKVVQAK